MTSGIVLVPAALRLCSIDCILESSDPCPGVPAQVSIEQSYGIAVPRRNIRNNPDLRVRNHSPESQRDLLLVNPLKRFWRDEYHFLRLIILRLGSASVCDAVHGKNGQNFTSRKWLHVHTLNPAMAPGAGVLGAPSRRQTAFLVASVQRVAMDGPTVARQTVVHGFVARSGADSQPTSGHLRGLCSEPTHRRSG